ncbi:MAG: hypothetical protein FK734_05135 [Asgard group archaeon]|nr:hypothetical protein [Asgard group archaeon]
MELKTFLITALIIDISTIIFLLPSESIYLIIPSFVASGLLGGLYTGYMRKRPLINCLYDGFIIGIPISITQGAIAIPILWYFHGLATAGAPLRFIFIIFSSVILLSGIVGSPAGSGFMGIIYRYLVRDRGEAELYDYYIEDKIKE